MIIPSAEYARHFDTIQVGMREGDVHSILGGPPNDYAPSPYFVLVGRSNRTKYPTGEEELIWVFDGCFIEVFLNKDGKVADKKWNAIDRPPLLDRVRYYLGI